MVNRVISMSHLIPTEPMDRICSFLRWYLFQVLSFRPMPRHIAFIMDGNRRYGRKRNLQEGEAHNMGFINLLSILRLCFEMGVEYVTVYAFSIDNFKRKPTEVRQLMDLIHEKIKVLIHDVGIVNRLGIRVEFIGNLELLDEPIREVARQAMAATVTNTRLVLLVCIAYTSTDEIVHAVRRSCEKVWARVRGGEDGDRWGDGSSGDCSISTTEMEKSMYFARHPDPDILIRTSGETRLSNFMLWQTTTCLLYTPRCLWPEISLRHLVWAVLQYQRNRSYLDKVKNQI